MQIDKIDLYTVELPYAGGVYHLSGGRSYTSFTAHLISMHTACGLTGWGESTPFGSDYIAAHPAGIVAAISEIAPHLLGQDPRLSDQLMDQMDCVLTGHLSAKAALDIAAWDLFGKATGMACCDLLGGRRTAHLPLISSIPTDTPEKMRANIAAHRAKGYKGHSLKVGALETEGGPALDAARLRACVADREYGELYLADANGGMSVESALRFLKLVSDIDFIFEAPVASWRETLSLRARTNQSLMLDELAQSDEDIAFILSENAADGFGLKITKNGGLTHARRQRDMAIAGGLSLSVQDTVGSTLSFAAILHMGHSVPASLLRCVLDVRDMVTRPLGVFPAVQTADGWRAPDLPGLGVEVDVQNLPAPIASWSA